MRKMWGAIAAAIALMLCAESQAQERPLLHPIFQDHAVLQRGKPIAVWGWAEPGARVRVTLDRAARIARAGADGRWRVDLPARAASAAALTLRVESGAAAQSVSDLLVGDVYLCSGQSNMEFQTRYATNAGVEVAAGHHPNLRLFQVTRRIADDGPRALPEPADRWAAASAESVADFSAVCYFFGRDLHLQTGVPIGLIHASWGGTIIEAWMSERAFTQLGGYDEAVALMQQNRADPGAARRRFTALMESWWAENDPGGRAGWFAPDFDDGAWRAIMPQGFWESIGEAPLAGFDGIAWYRTEFTLTAAQAALGGRFELGPADDIDATYLNGRAIGAMSGWDQPRNYDVAPGALRAGRNVLAAAVLDSGGGGGFWGPADAKLLRLSDGSVIPLNNVWRYAISAPLGAVSAPPQAPWGGPNGHAVLFNGMVAPLAPYGLAGVVWYQGESNAGAPDEYARLTPAWMADWRARFEAPRLPFFITQLANFGMPAFGEPAPFSWGGLRDVQRRVVDADGRAGLAVTIDIGDRYDIHPTQKLIVGQRLARHALAMIYGVDVITDGPKPISAQRAGDGVRVRFSHGPLLSYGGHRPIGFELCDASRACQFVDALVEGEEIVLTPRGGLEPAFVRYCWGDAPVCNLYNAEDLPAAGFELEIR